MAYEYPSAKIVKDQSAHTGRFGKLQANEDTVIASLTAQNIDGPVLVEFIVEQHDMVYPMVATGADLNDMISRPVHDQFQESEM